MKSSILREIERKQADRPVEERFDMEPKKKFNASRRKPVTAEQCESCEEYLKRLRNVMSRF